MKTCDGCRLCCWSFNVDVPHPTLLSIIEPKRELRHCHHECERGCALHDNPQQPDICRTFQCPYIRDEEVHRPDTFQPLLESLNGNMGNYIPAVSTAIPIESARQLIADTRTILAYMLLDGRWLQTVLPLDKDANGAWATTEPMVSEWGRLYESFGQTLALQRNDVEHITV